MESFEFSDSKLVELSLKNSDYFAILIDRYADPLGRYVRRRSKATSHDVDDILQEIFIKVYRNLNGFDNSLSFSSWIYRIARNHLIDWYRKEKKRDSISLDDEDSTIAGTLVGGLPTDAMARQGDVVKEVGIALDSLSPLYKDVLVLRFFEDKSYDEISDIMRIPVSVVGVRINRGKAMLKKKLDNLLLEG